MAETEGWSVQPLQALLIGLVLASAVTGASADPLIAGCCDSITSQPSYLDLIENVYLGPNVDDLGVDSSPSSSGLIRLEDYLLTEDPDAVIVLSGTPDTFFDKPEGGGWGPPEGYVEDTTVSNIADMVNDTLADGAEPIVVAPPPVLADCSGNSEYLSCTEIDFRLESLSVALDDLALGQGVGFVDLYTLFSEDPDPTSLYNWDGVHPNHDFGDPVIADAILPELAAIFCGDGILDPGEECDDGNTDPRDGCSPTCSVEPECFDGLDNDGDGAADFGGDFGCDSAEDLSERSPLIACDDGVDNDGDGLTDFPADPGCGYPLHMTESPACNDSIDNDGDTLVDLDDPQCGSASQTSEAKSTSCGLGVELAVFLPPLLWWRRRHRVPSRPKESVFPAIRRS